MSEANANKEDGKSRKREMEEHTEDDDDDDDIFHCPVCLEEFEVTGDRLPRFLSCAHSICTKCVEDMLKPKTLVCPLCRKKHKAENGIKSFPRNKYILPSLKSRNEERKRKKELHGKLGSVKQAVSKKLESFNDVKGRLFENYANCQAQIKERREEINRLFDTMHEVIQSEKERSESIVNVDISAMKGDITLLENVESEMKTKEISLDGLMNSYKIINDIQENNSKIPVKKLSDFTEFVFFIQSDEEDTRKLCGTLWIQTVDGDSENKLDGAGSSTSNASASNASDLYSEEDTDEESVDVTDPTKFSCTEERSFQLDMECNGKFEVLHDSTIAVCGHKICCKCGCTRLLRFTRKGDKVGSAWLNDSPAGIAEVMLNGNWTLAILGLNNKKIDFRDVNNFERIIHTYDISLHDPDCLCVSGSLLFVKGDRNADDQDTEVHILDCAGPKPKRCGSLQSVREHGCLIYDMCVVEHKGKELLVVAGSKISVFNIKADKMMWQTDPSIEGMDRNIECLSITTDGRGHLFASDEENQCIQVFHVADRRYLGALTGSSFSFLERLRWMSSSNEMMTSDYGGDTLQFYKVLYPLV